MFVIGNLLRYAPAKKYENRPWCDKINAKNKMVQFSWTHVVYTCHYYYYY